MVWESLGALLSSLKVFQVRRASRFRKPYICALRNYEGILEVTGAFTRLGSALLLKMGVDGD